MGSTTITKATRGRLARKLEQDVDTSGGALCFLPHHGIRIIAGRKVHDLVLCYGCGHIRIHTSGVAERRLNLSGKPDDLDEFLLTAGVPLVPR
ncbi:MAG: hypothetical protein EOP84_10455 [Verrucomicrobiaceae bacterium]|nr:MAG: hypothetical protein EOP84_10455 [Verrucomicrobiaceae bacterium]